MLVGQDWWLAFAIELVEIGREFVSAIEHIVVGDKLAVCAAMRPILVTILAFTPRSTSL